MSRIATRQGLLGKSFERAAEAISDAVGCPISRESVRKLTQEWGKKVDESRQKMAAEIFEATQPEPVLPEPSHPIEKQATMSTDGGMVHIREEGWKEVKLSVISAVRPKTETERTTETRGRRYAPYEPQMMLHDHSYQAGLWEPDKAGQHLYLEALRRGVPECWQVSAVSDGARWIERITAEQFPEVTQIVDWFHAAEKMWGIGRHFFPEKTACARWVNQQLDALWQGKLPQLLEALEKLPETDEEQIRSALGYFERQQKRMAYHRYRIAGFPIGSGCVESGINTVVHHRLKTQGRGWQRENAHAMLAALGELHSNRFDSVWSSLN